MDPNTDGWLILQERSEEKKAFQEWLRNVDRIRRWKVRPKRK